MAISNYARVALRVAEDGKHHRGTVKVLTPGRCDHLETMCAECIVTWSWDWTIRTNEISRTRLLKDGPTDAELAQAADPMGEGIDRRTAA